MEAPPEPRSRRRARALPPQHGPAMASHVASTWPRPCCTAQPPPAALYARTTVRLRLWVPSMGTDKMPVRPGRPCAAMAMATRLMAETGMMMPASGSDGSCWSKVAEMQQLRMPPHERQWSTTLLPLSRSRTPPSRSQHIDSRSLEDRVAAGITCWAVAVERWARRGATRRGLFLPFVRYTLSHLQWERGRSTTPLGPTLPSLVTAREYRSYCDLLYVHQVPGHGWARRATSSRGRRHVKCSGRWLCSKQRRRLK